MPYAAQTLTTNAGTAGRVRNVTTNQIIAGLSKWERNSPAAIIPIPNFESSTDADTGLVQPNKLLGLGDNKFTLTGYFNRHATYGTEVVAATNFKNGAYVYLDFILDKTSTKGWANVPGWITNVQIGVDVNNQPLSFTCVFEVDGALPAWGNVT